MITNGKVTLYTIRPDGTYTRTVAAAFWVDGKTVKSSKLVVSVVDSSSILVPILVNPDLDIHAKTDYIVRGVCDVEAPTGATISTFLRESGARALSAASKNDYGSIDLHHWALEVSQ